MSSAQNAWARQPRATATTIVATANALTDLGMRITMPLQVSQAVPHEPFVRVVGPLRGVRRGGRALFDHVLEPDPFGQPAEAGTPRGLGGVVRRPHLRRLSR